MSVATALPSRPASGHPARGTLLLIAAIVGFSVVLGVGLGNPTPLGRAAIAAIAAIGIVAVVTLSPYVAFLTLQASAVMLIVVSLGPERSLNAFDLIMPLLLLVGWLGSARTDARAASEAESGAAHEAIRGATRGFTRAVTAYFGLAILSMAMPILAGKYAEALDSGEILIRGIQGVLMFPMGMWWLRSEHRVRQAIGAMLIGGGVFAIVNLCALLSGSLTRAGLTWFANEPLWSIAGPNEAAGAMLLLWVLVLARNSMRFQIRNVILLMVILVMLVLTQSRSGLLTWLIFNLLALGRGRWGHLALGVLAVLAVLPLVPTEYWERMARTLVLERGSFEAFSALVRVFGWQAAWQVFLDHPIFGVGYLGFRHLSTQYNDLGVYLLTTENIFLEAATGMGIFGVAALVWVLVGVYKLGAVVKKVTPSGTLGHHIASLHAPLVTGLLIANMTANNWTGLVGLAQFALWNALLVRSGHAAVTKSTPA
jgi:O-antigen ligase